METESGNEGREASFLIEDTKVADVYLDALQVFQRVERSVESYDAYSLSLRTSLLNSIESLRKRGVKGHDLSLEDFVAPGTEMSGNITSDIYFDDFIRSNQTNSCYQVSTELFQDMDNFVVVIVPE